MGPVVWNAAVVVGQGVGRLAGLVQNIPAQGRHLTVQMFLTDQQFLELLLFSPYVGLIREVVEIATGIVGGQDIDTALLLHLHYLHIRQQPQGPADGLRGDIVLR